MDPGLIRRAQDGDVESSRDLHIVVHRFPGDVDDHRRLPPRPRLGVLLDDGVDARVLEPDRVEHPAGGLGHARGGIADPRPQRGALAADRAEALHVDDLAVFDAVPERSGGDKNGIGEDQVPIRDQAHRQIDIP